MFSPSGEQFALAFEDQEAVVVEVGGGLRSYQVDGRELIDGYGPGEMCPSGRGQVLIPWPNRVAGGAYAFAGRDLQLPVNEPATGSAIHGLTRWAAWTAVEREPHRVVVRHELHPQPGYPFALAIVIEYALSADGLRISTTATNVGADPCPFGAGAHPYLRPGSPVVDAAILHLPAESVLRVDADGIHVGVPVEGTEFDFLRPRPLGRTTLDHCFTDLQPGDDGLTRVSFTTHGCWNRSNVVGGRGLPVPDALHRRRQARRESPQHGDRADDVPAAGIPNRSRRRPPRPRRLVHGQLGPHSAGGRGGGG